MCRKFTPDELNTMDHESRNDVIYQMQDRWSMIMKTLWNRCALRTSSVSAAIRKNWMRSQDSFPFLMKRKQTAMKTCRNQR